MAYPHKKEAKINGRSLEITLRSDADASVYFEIFDEREYSILDPIILSSKNTIIDIGAHTGMFSMYASSIQNKTPILAYEPSPENFELLKKNIRENNFLNIFPKNLAVSSESGQRVLFLKEDSHNHSLISDEFDINEQKIFTTSLSQIVDKIQAIFDTDRADLLKIDAEGIEFEIFEKTDKKIIKKFENIYMEYHELNENMKGENLRHILEKMNYKVRIFPSKYDSRFGFILAKKK